MTIPSLFPRIALTAVALATLSVTGLRADDTTGTSPTCKHHGHGHLTEAEKAELKKDRDQVFANDPSLKTQEAALKSEHKADKSSTAGTDKKAMHSEYEAYRTKMHDAMVKVDPAIEPVLAKLESEHHHHHSSSSEQ